MMDAVSLGVFSVALMLTAGSPGPSIAALVARVISSGWRDVMPFLAAMWIGEVIWLTCAVAGLSALAEQFQTAFVVLKYAGVAYLLFLSWQMWRAPVAQEGAELPNRQSPRAMFMAGMAVTLGNPKIMLFYVALLPSLIDLSDVGLGLWALLAVIAVASVALPDVIWVTLAHRARRFLRTPDAMKTANRLGATTLGGAAAMIAAR